MLRITNGVITITVSKGAYKSLFEGNGFRVLNGAPGEEDAGVDTTHGFPKLTHLVHSSQQGMEQNVEDTEEEADVEEGYEDEEETDLSEIPLGEMSFDQLNEYADQLELDHDGIRSKKELRALIRKHLNS